MSSTNAINFGSLQQRFQHLSLSTLCKSIAITSLSLILIYAFSNYNHPYGNYSSYLSMPFELKWTASNSPNNTNSPTNISHIMFVIVSSLSTWKHRKAYVDAWWRENVTRGNLFFDEAPNGDFHPWPSSSPPFQVNEDIRKLKIYPKLVSPIQVRIYRSIWDTFKLGAKDVRWYVMLDDDSLLFVDNLVEVLSKYDHTKYHYLGTNSECVKSNFDFSFEMGFGGAGYALSYSLVEAVAPRIDACIERYPYLHVSDQLSSSCLADLRVDLTLNKGFHQVDLHGDISGLLSSHPNTPALTLHHFQTIDPIFPNMNRTESVNRLMKAAKTDQSRLLQQTICYHRETNWSFSISWGYSAHIYENIIPRSVLKRPIETFRPWQKTRPPIFMFNTRWPFGDPCQAPHVFFFDSLIDHVVEGNQAVVAAYNRTSPRNLTSCSSSGNHSADSISNIQVFSPATTRKEGGRIECCDVRYAAGTNTADVKIRACMNDEIIA
ncbi:DUF604 domain-containing protein [Cephalotus follicularis]|uniref:DUF604 domain-containing protein n=1 Tax=Cephalotus follicularis TaxID=3775 RepID=A0A1Q3CIC6_CEPFO|nr:DUF604 domain-containing protein [Cephalotus follicularis]